MRITMILVATTVMGVIAFAVGGVVLSDSGSQEPESVLKPDYDDSWIASLPKVVGGYRVLFVDTPKSRACSVAPLIVLQTPNSSLSGFLSAAPDLLQMIQQVPEVPADAGVSFTNASIDLEAKAAEDKMWNAQRARDGCIRWMRPGESPSDSG